tara:strand:+ start:471 stop:2243 length:1773 start_codon:yes stop_codon:yes gene_type:complete
MTPIGHYRKAPRRIFPLLSLSLHWLLVMAASLLLFACAGPSVEPDLEGSVLMADETMPLPVEGEQINLKAIERVTHLAKTDSLLAARYERNHLLLADLDASTLLFIDSVLAWFSGNTTLADQLLTKLARDNTAALDLVLQEREARRALEGDWLAAAETLFQRSHAHSGSRQDEAVSDRLFGYLLRLDTATLAEARRGARDPNWRQWLEMQVVYREGPEALAAWMTRPNAPPQRPAMPRHVTRWVTAESVDHIALLLPLGGRLAGAGEAVLSGAIDQLYTLFPDPSSRPVLTTLNSTQPVGIWDLYRQAVADGVDLIIGPLIKEDVASLGQLAQRTVPVIALNQTDSLTGSLSRNWMSLSLAPEDEARQIADVAFGQACRHAIVVGVNSDRGARLLSSFSDRWTQHGGRIRGQLVVDNSADTNTEMGKLLGSGSSDQRIRAVERAFDLPVDARGRGRSDFECIFMLAPDAATARAWRPLLVFHMTGDIPVYATSAINDGVADTRNRDLNGVVFVETPAMFPPEMTDRLSRLRALGRDALTLAQHWQQTIETTQWVVRGQTGLLRRKQDGSVERELELATFDGARIRPAALP